MFENSVAADQTGSTASRHGERRVRTLGPGAFGSCSGPRRAPCCRWTSPAKGNARVPPASGENERRDASGKELVENIEGKAGVDRLPAKRPKPGTSLGYPARGTKTCCPGASKLRRLGNTRHLVLFAGEESQLSETHER